MYSKVDVAEKILDIYNSELAQETINATVQGLCKGLIEKEKLSRITSDLDGIIPRIRELSDEAEGIACSCDSFNESFRTWRDNDLTEEIVDEVQRAWSQIDEGSSELERIADDYEEKVQAELHRLDPENYELEE